MMDWNDISFMFKDTSTITDTCIGSIEEEYDIPYLGENPELNKQLQNTMVQDYLDLSNKELEKQER